MDQLKIYLSIDQDGWVVGARGVDWDWEPETPPDSPYTYVLWTNPEPPPIPGASTRFNWNTQTWENLP